MALLVGVAVVGGCAVRTGTVPVLPSGAMTLPTMVLATGVEGCDCTRAWVRPAAAPSLTRAVEAALAEVDEGVVLVEAWVETSALSTGLYNRRCVRVRGSAAKLVRQVVLPAPAGHHGHH